MNKIHHFLLSTTSVILSLALQEVGAAHYKVFLLGGQSNMVGHGQSSQLPTELQAPQNDVQFYYGTGGLQPLQPGSGVVRTFVTHGPEITFGRAVADARPSENFAIIKHAQGGSTLFNNWSLGSTTNTYANFRTIVNDGLTALSTAGHTYEITGMLWTQGESDGLNNRTTVQYQTNLVNFVADIRTRYGANLPFYLSRLSDNQETSIGAGYGAIRTAQENFAASDPNAWLIDTDGFSVVPTDTIHFDTAGQMALGEAFAASYLAIPEPSTTLLTLIGALAVLRRRR